MASPDPWVLPDDVRLARGIALGLAVASLFWGGIILVLWG